MKFLLAFLILAASPLQAQVSRNCKVIDCPSGYMPTPAPPSASARQTVATALAAVKHSESDEEIAAKALNDQAEVIKIKLEKDAPWYKPWKIVTDDEIRAATLSDPEYLRLMLKHQSAVAANYAAHNTAILETMKAYNLIPPVRDFTGDPRAAGVNMVAKPWLPHYSRHEKRDAETGQWRKRRNTELDEEKLRNSVFGGGVAAAVTRGDGVIQIWDQAFTNPEELALNIFHETSHWVDISAKSGGFTKRDLPEVSFRSEQHAYKRTAVFARQIGADPTHLLNLARQFKFQADISEKEHLTKDRIKANPGRFGMWLGTDWKGQLAISPAEPELSADDEALLRTKMAQAQKEVMEARKHQELMEELRRKTDAMPPPAELHPTGPDGLPLGFPRAVPTAPDRDGPARLNPSQPPLWPLQFREIAGCACSSPPKPMDRLLAAVDWGNVQRSPDAGSTAEDLPACERRVVLRLIELGRGWRPGTAVSADSVRAAAADTGSTTGPGGGTVPPSPDHNPVWGKIAPIIRR